ncbi:MAG TPA: ATP-binding protein [Phycisphaerales bacterium]|nr:ATP-binding protein [Phycisphaerales bacterium]
MQTNDSDSRACDDLGRISRPAYQGRWHFLYGTLLIVMAAVTLGSHVRLQLELNSHTSPDPVIDASVRVRRHARDLAVDAASAIEAAADSDELGVRRYANSASHSVRAIGATIEAIAAESGRDPLPNEAIGYAERLASLHAEAAAAVDELASIEGGSANGSIIPICRGIEVLSSQMVTLTDQAIRDLTALYDQEHRNLSRSSLALAAVTALLFTAYAGLMLGPVARTVRAQLRELERARAAAMEGIRSKGEFMANVTHELRTPLTSILGYADLLRDPRTPESERAEYAEIIHNNGTHLLQLINDLLDLAKLDAGRMTVSRVACSPAEIVERTVQLLRPAAERKRLTLEYVIHEGVPRTIESDPDRLRQVLINLAGNAVKFTFSGGVRIEVHAEGEPDRPTAVRFEVYDTGIGIDEETLDRLFTPFVQAETSTTRRFGGTGLGLAISNDLARLLGGRITVQSERAKGSVFTLRIHLPEARVSDPTNSLGTLHPLQGVRVLLAEDGDDNRRLLTHLLRAAGAHVETARDGIEACTLVEGAKAPFSVILMDLQMPELDGLGAVRRLRAAGCRTPVVALTANNRPNDRDACFQAGCDDYLVKPIERARLITECRRWHDEGGRDSPDSRAAA